MCRARFSHLWIACVALAGLLELSPRPAAAEPVTLVRNNGPSANRVDFVVLGDGYTAAELASGKYAADVEAMLQGLFAQEPYSEYRKYYNVRRIDVTSAESGADHPELVPAVYRNTALDAAYNCAAIARLICVNTYKVSTILTNSGIPSDARDFTLILVNDTTYGGSGGAVAVASLHPQTVELVLHETGHAFAQLGDEYGGNGACVSPPEPLYPNVTALLSRAAIKWQAWIGATTPLPTTTTDPNVVGAFAGGDYCDSGLYRPSSNSKMRTLGAGFYPVNTEAHVRRVYNLVSPIDAASPAGTSLTMGASQLFTVTPTQPFTHALSVVWTVDGVQQGTGTQFTASNLSAGQHTVAATVADGTAWVRSDPSGLLSDVRSWVVTVQTSGPGAFAKVSPANAASAQSTSPTLTWSTSSGAAAYEYCLDTTNDNACTAWVSTGTSTTAVLSGLSAGTTYYWQARSSASGSTTWADGASTAFWSFTTQVATPGAFVKTSPTSGTTGVTSSPTLTWAASGGATAYEYCLDTTNDNTCASWTNVGTSTSVGLSGLTALTTYYWQVRATNAAGTVYAGAGATAYATFTTQAAAPGAFGKTAPSNGATGQTTTPTLSWSASSGATAYEYCLDATNDNACLAWVSTGTSTSTVVAGLSAGTSYYWHVRATNAGGTTYAGASATAHSTFTTQVTLPGAFLKTAPVDRTTGQTISPTLSWAVSSGATTYEYCIDTTNDNACSTWLSVGANTSVGLSGLSSATVYYWHVRATNAGGTTYSGGSTSAFRSFTTQVAAPGAFAKSAPATGATGQPTTPTLGWSASSGATAYEYCVDATNDNACASWTSVGTNTSVGLTGLSTGTTYYWQVRATNTVGTTYANGSVTGFWAFTTTTPTPVTLGSFTTSRTTATTQTPVVFTASATGGTGAYEYRFALYDAARASWMLLQNYATTPMVSWTPGAAGTYWVQVWVRSVGSNVTYEDWRNSATVTVAP